MQVARDQSSEIRERLSTTSFGPVDSVLWKIGNRFFAVFGGIEVHIFFQDPFPKPFDTASWTASGGPENIVRRINSHGQVDHGFEAYRPTTVEQQLLATQIEALQLTNVGPTRSCLVHLALQAIFDLGSAGWPSRNPPRPTTLCDPSDYGVKISRRIRLSLFLYELLPL